MPFIFKFDGKVANDEEEYFKFCEDLSTSGIYFSSTFQQRDDQRHMHVVVNDSYEEYAAIGDTSHCDRDINDLQNVNHNIDDFDFVPNASADLGCQEDQFVPFGNPKDNEQIEGTTCNKFGSATNTRGNPQFSDLQTKEECNRYEEEDDDLEIPEQQGITHPSQSG